MLFLIYPALHSEIFGVKIETNKEKRCLLSRQEERYEYQTFAVYDRDRARGFYFSGG